LTGWTLPNIDQLNMMYKNLHLNGLGGFDGTYWSSSQRSSNLVWTKNFDYNYEAQSSQDKTLTASKVRAIRAF